MKMKNLLSENMLRFGTKNLSESNLESLKELNLIVESVTVSDAKGGKSVDAPNSSFQAEKRNVVVSVGRVSRSTSEPEPSVSGLKSGETWRSMTIDTMLFISAKDINAIRPGFFNPGDESTKYAQYTAKITRVDIQKRDPSNDQRAILDTDELVKTPIPIQVNPNAPIPISHTLNLKVNNLLRAIPLAFGKVGWGDSSNREALDSGVAIEFEITKTIPAQYFIDKATNFPNPDEASKQKNIERAKQQGDVTMVVKGRGKTTVRQFVQVRSVQGEPG